MSSVEPILLTDKYLESGKARAVPYAFFQDGGWFLPPDPDPESCRYALRLFPRLASNPLVVSRARLSAASDPRPIDAATAAWVERPVEEDPWPATMGGLTPHLYQRQDAQYAIDCLNAGRGAYVGWSVGLGKSLGAAMVMAGWQSNFTLLVCPNSAKFQWKQMLRSYLPGLPVLVVGNNAAARESTLADAKRRGDSGYPFVLVCHFEAVPLIDGKNKRGWLPLGQWDLVVIDEAHQIKGRSAKRTAAIRRLKRAGTLMLSGSVMSGKPDELFVPLQILRPAKYRSARRDWVDKYMEVVETDWATEVVGPKLDTLDEMRAELGEVLVIRRAEDHLDIPEAHEITHDVRLHPAQRKAYRDLAEELLAELPDGTVVGTTDGAPLMSALRQVTGGKGCEVSAKHDRAMEILDGAQDTQVLVFTWHKAPGYLLQERCAAADISCGLVNGDVKREDRDATIESFKRGDLKVLCATVSTLGVAANLQCAGAVIFLEESFVAVDNEQAVGRAVRQGQTQNVSIHWIRAVGTVDGHVQQAAMSKLELRRLILGA